MSRQEMGNIQSGGLLLFSFCILTDKVFIGGPFWFHPVLNIGIAIGLPLACYKDAKLKASVLLAVGWVAIIFFHLSRWPSITLFTVCSVVIAYTGYKEIVTKHRNKAASQRPGIK